MKSPGLRSMQMLGNRPDGTGGRLTITVEPSIKVKEGLFIAVHEELQAPASQESDGAQWVPTCISEHWSTIIDSAEGTAQHLLSLVK